MIDPIPVNIESPLALKFFVFWTFWPVSGRTVAWFGGDDLVTDHFLNGGSGEDATAEVRSGLNSRVSHRQYRIWCNVFMSILCRTPLITILISHISRLKTPRERGRAFQLGIWVSWSSAVSSLRSISPFPQQAMLMRSILIKNLSIWYIVNNYRVFIYNTIGGWLCFQYFPADEGETLNYRIIFIGAKI